MQKELNKKFSFLRTSYFRLRGGFTLIEMLMAMLIFISVIGAITGIFISGIRQQRNLLFFQSILDEASYDLEYIGRTLRLAKKDLTGSCIPAGSNFELTRAGTGLKFINHLQSDDCQEFFFDANQIKYRRKIGQPEEGILPMTSIKLQVVSLNFSLVGESQDDNLQPMVTIFSEIKGIVSPTQTQTIKIQTSISQRNLDIAY